MKILKTRPHTKPARARDGYVQIRVDGRWRANRDFYVGSCSYQCDASGIDLEFVQLEDDADCEVVASAGVKPWNIAYGNVFRRCKVCGRFRHTGYGYRPKGSSIQLAHATPRWATA